MTFKTLNQASAEELKQIVGGLKHNVDQLADHILQHFYLMKSEKGSFSIDRYTHGLQTATRAFRDGRDEEYVVCALLHDFGDYLAPYNHGELIATILKPFIEDKNYWMLKHHTVFQGYYWWDKIGGNNKTREKYKDSPHYDYTVEFCEKYDNMSFDTDYHHEDIEFFIPMLKRLLQKKPKKENMICDYGT
jgi:predicted HD phosphohydrolase